MSTHWHSNKRFGWAHREDGGLTLIGHRDVLFLLSDQIAPLDAKDLPAAMQEADQKHPPTGWSCVFGAWLSENWQVKPKREEGAVVGWTVHSREGEQKSKQVFDRADLARKWCEVRKDRVGLNLRGPKPKKTADPAA